MKNFTPRSDAANVDKSEFSDWGFGKSGFVRFEDAANIEVDLLHAISLLNSACKEFDRVDEVKYGMPLVSHNLKCNIRKFIAEMKAKATNES